MKHIIVVKWVSEVDDKTKSIFIPQIKELFENTKEIDGVHSVQILENCIHVDTRADLMIQLDMEKTSLPEYNESQWHQLWKHEYGRFIKEKLVIDID